MLEQELKKIDESEDAPPKRFSLLAESLKIIGETKHPARSPLVWQNFCFGGKSRKTIRLRPLMHATNSPLSLHPEILDEVLKYVFLPKEVISAYRKELEKRPRNVQQSQVLDEVNNEL